MKILALEFSSPHRSVAALDVSSGSDQLACFEVVEAGGHGTKALGMVEETLAKAQIPRERVDCIVVGLGPGSYTGIRGAIALAQGWQLARGTRLLGISSAECIAAQAQAQGASGTAAVVIDAQRGEFYLGIYDLAASTPRERQKLKLASAIEVQFAEASGHLLVGPEVTRWFPNGQTIFPTAAILGQLAVTCTDFIAGAHLEPIYLRETTFVKSPPPRLIPT